MDAEGENSIDTGTAYGLEPRNYNRDLIEVGPRTPMGELMRRYWQPCFTSADLVSDRPRKVRLLGENLILFRDKNGKAGLVHEHCCHRGTSLYYGRIEEDGIRCCYHGWKFDTKGHCLDQPAEVDGGSNRSRVRQPWYPVEERYGLVYAYMGPPEKKPVLPRWAHLENLEPGEIVEAAYGAAYGPVSHDPDGYEMQPLPFNWLQTYENGTDGAHVPWLHYHHSCDQFTGLRTEDNGGALPLYAIIKDAAARIAIERTPRGLKVGNASTTPDGSRNVTFYNELIFPNINIISGFIDLYYIVPVDDTHFVTFNLFRTKKPGAFNRLLQRHYGKTWWEMTAAEHQSSPGDYEAQVSIGALPAHNHEHFSPGDVGVGVLRRQLGEAVRAVAEGREPPGIIFDEKDAVIETSKLAIPTITSLE